MLIVIFPILTFQIIMLTYYFNSLWERTLSRLARSVAAEVNMIVDQVEQKNLTENEIKNDLGKTLGLQISFTEEEIDFNNQLESLNLVFKNLNKELRHKVKYPYVIEPDKANKSINILVSIEGQIIKIGILEDRITTSRNHVFLGWLLISSSILFTSTSCNSATISFSFITKRVR